MKLNRLGSLLNNHPVFEELTNAFKEESANFKIQILSEATPYFLSTLSVKTRQPILAIAPTSKKAQYLYEQLLIWTDKSPNILHFPDMEMLPFERVAPDIPMMHQRIQTLSRLISEDNDVPLLVTSLPAIRQKTIDRNAFESSIQIIKVGDSVVISELSSSWIRAGYEFEHNVTSPGQYSRRGGILDIFPVGSDSPFRLEFWGNDIDSIRVFDTDTQVSTKNVNSVKIPPAIEWVPGILDPEMLHELVRSVDLSTCTARAKELISGDLDSLNETGDLDNLNLYCSLFMTGSIFDFVPRTGIVFAEIPDDIISSLDSTDRRVREIQQTKEQRGELPLNFPSPFYLGEDIQNFINEFNHRLDITQWGTDTRIHKNIFKFPIESVSPYNVNNARFSKEISEMISEGHFVVMITSVPKRLKEILEEKNINVISLKHVDDIPVKNSVLILDCRDEGPIGGLIFSTKTFKLVILGDTEIFGVAKKGKSARRKSNNKNSFISELVPGDFVVHVEHGVGKFTSIEEFPDDEAKREYLTLEYAANDKLFVPMEHIDRISPYVAPIDKTPKLTRLGTQEWSNAKKRVARSAMEMASELISLYASREMVTGHKFKPDTKWQQELENSFPYKETLDQLKAIRDVKADMEQSTPMDRVICGDVGYGKTEIAIRSAFKAVMDGMQVAILVPTTILAQQHYETFTERLGAYPVNIEVLSRFRNERIQSSILDGLKFGSIDICIGTHRLVQRDIGFKNLGLVIIDEEQRFGVTHKERLKQIRNEVDVLTMTATPIPRTLHLSLAGIRDMSMIETSPEERLPIKTYVSEFNDDLIIEAIRREMDRQGQVFFLHNRVEDIDSMAKYINKLVPEARMGIAHGQMLEKKLEHTMLNFAAGKMDVLVCTTIIESGLDIPNVNTLIMNRSDRFGLSQMYQLRGRIGRSSRRAYAYMLVPPSKSLTETAEKRLKTMLSATELGSGFQIAIKDLELRGAGNVLGSAQSGHIHAVGFDLYTKLLEEAVENIRGKEGYLGYNNESDLHSNLETLSNVHVNLKIPANIPTSYVEDISTRLGIYRKIASINTIGEVNSLEHEFQDRFGPIPIQTINLLYVMGLRINAVGAGISSIIQKDKEIIIKLSDETGGAKKAIQKLLGRKIDVGNMQMRVDITGLNGNWETFLGDIIDKLVAFRTQLLSLST
jgi:transcription-repair coupling factor (superfamily II helicase)